MKTALVIQGPLLSSGLTGSSLDSGSGANPADVVSKFDCIPAIMENLESCGNAFDEVILCTWSTEDVSKIPSDTRIRIVAVAPAANRLVDYGPDRPNHKLFQAHGRLEGIVAAQNFGCGFVAAVRTDQVLDCALLLEDSLNFPDAITVPLFNPSAPDWLQDFYLAGSARNLQDFFLGVLQRRPLYRSAHHDYFYQYVKLREEANRNLRLLDFFPAGGTLTPGQKRLINDAWAHHFRPAPVEIWNNLVWRGAPNAGRLSFSAPREFVAAARVRFSVPNLVYFLLGDRLGARASRNLQRFAKFLGRVRRDGRRRLLAAWRA